MVYAASSPWTQTDWSGGSGQTSWSDATKFDSSSSVTTSTAGQATLTNTEEFTNTDFETDLSGWDTNNQWWLAGGVSPANAVGVYQPIGAADLSSSYTNLANPGTYNAAPGVAPTFSAATGWTFNGSTQYLDTGILPGLTWSALVRFSGLTGTASVESLLAAYHTVSQTFIIDADYASSAMRIYNGGTVSNAPIITSGVYGLAGKTAYRNGVAEANAVAAGGTPVTRSLYIAASHYSITAAYGQVSIQSIAIYNGTLNANQVEAITNSMNALGATTATRDTETKYAGAASSKLVVTSGNGTYTQSVNVGDTSTYNLSAYAYTGAPVTTNDVNLYVGSSTISTTFTPVDAGLPNGWYHLTGTTAGTASSVAYGVQVKADKTVYLDDMSLNSYATSGTITSSIFDTELTSATAWGNLTYTATTPTNTSVSVKARTSNSSSMSGATAFSSCDAITSGSDISNNNCVTDGHRYIQYQIDLANTDSVSTPTFQDVSIAFSSSDSSAPSISLTALSPDPNTDTTPTVSGTATELVDIVSNVQFQMDGTSGSWSSCTADDGAFDEASETFTCTPSTALSDSSHTMYVRATDSNSNTTASGSESSDTFTIDATAPNSIDLDSPGNNSYTNSERPSFKWKATTDATAGLSKYVLEIDNPSAGSGQPSGDFTIDDIPTSRTTDYETNRYVIHYENFSDSDATNNYISVYTKSSSEWSTDSASGQNDGKVREGKVSWKVKARDNAGNETSSSRTLFIDRTNPKVEFTQVNDSPFSSTSFSTTDKTPTIYGKITDPLSGGDSSSVTCQVPDFLDSMSLSKIDWFHFES